MCLFVIRINFDNNTQTLTIHGHAFYQDENDIVCAGVSSIILGAANYWFDHDQISIEQQASGWLQIGFGNHCLQNDSKLQSEFDLVWHQLSLLASNYSQHVVIEQTPNWIVD